MVSHLALSFMRLVYLINFKCILGDNLSYHHPFLLPLTFTKKMLIFCEKSDLYHSFLPHIQA